METGGQFHAPAHLPMELWFNPKTVLTLYIRQNLSPCQESNPAFSAIKLVDSRYADGGILDPE
jgi:hypothetical protein